MTAADRSQAAGDAVPWLLVGHVARPHGLDGSFYVAQPRADLLGLGATVTVRGAERTIVRRSGTDARPILRLDGADDRSAAEDLRGAELRVTRAAAPALGPEEWWAEDLVGCTVRDGARAVGVVGRLLGLPSCEVLAVERDGADELLVPLVHDAVRAVDVDRRTIEIDLAFLGAD